MNALQQVKARHVSRLHVFMYVCLLHNVCYVLYGYYICVYMMF